MPASVGAQSGDSPSPDGQIHHLYADHSLGLINFPPLTKISHTIESVSPFAVKFCHSSHSSCEYITVNYSVRDVLQWEDVVSVGNEAEK